MNKAAARLAQLKKEGRKAFAPFVMAGYPSLAASAELLRGYARAGADLIEVAVPFSDPMADGPVNQAAAQAALAGGADIDRVLALLAEIAPKLPCPLVLFSYLNPVLQRKIPNFVDEATAAGAAGLIVPDLPPEEAGELRTYAKKKDLGLVFLIAPTSPPERITLADEASTGFLYAVSLRGVTGARKTLAADLPDFLGRVRPVVKNPVIVGFGIGSPEQARTVSAMADGVIVASALVRLAGLEGVEASCRLARELRAAI